MGRAQECFATEDAAQYERVDLNSLITNDAKTVEESFKTMKGDLGLRPNFHHHDIPTIAHVHVTVLAYHMLAGILKKLRTIMYPKNWTVC